MLQRIIGKTALVVLAAGTTGLALAGGEEGHQAIAAIATGSLIEPAKRQVTALLANDATGRDLISVAIWPDRVRLQRPETAHWHFVKIPISANGYLVGQDCKSGDCVVEQSGVMYTRVADKRLATPVRAEALKFLLHIVGDIHQPLHSADNIDRGGNAVTVRLENTTANLHKVWDTLIIRSIDTDRESLAREIITTQIKGTDFQTWSRNLEPAPWASEAFAIAKTKIFGPLGGVAGTPDAPIILPATYA